MECKKQRAKVKEKGDSKSRVRKQNEKWTENMKEKVK